MPVDLSRLPAQVTCEDRGTSAVVWLIVFVFVMGAGAGLTLWLWPADRSTHSGTFWAWLLGVPALVFASLLSLRLGLYEHAKRSAQIHNDMRAEGLRIATVHAQRPLYLIECAYGTALGIDCVAERIVARESALETSYVGAAQARIRHSRLTELDGPAGEQPPSALERLETVYLDLIDRIVEAIRALPDRLILGVVLAPPSVVEVADALETWRRAWATSGLNRRIDGPSVSTQGLMDIDTWLDEAGASERALLLVSVELHDVPPPESTEAGVALLFASDAAANRMGHTQGIFVHRPVQANFEDAGKAFESALQWGAISVDGAASMWVSGLDSAGNAAATIAWTNTGKDASHILDVDAALGHAGAAADWLGVALAVEQARSTKFSQLIVGQRAKMLRMAAVTSRFGET